MFVPFTVLLLIFIVVLFKILPETKGKTIEQISMLFNKDLAYMSSQGQSDAIDGRGTFTQL